MTGIDRVILDTNALLAPGRSGVDVFDEIERVVGGAETVMPAAVRRELHGLARDDPDAELGLDMAADRCAVREAPGESSEGAGSADDAIVAMAEAWSDDGAEGGVAVATNDAALRDRLHGVGVPVLFLRQKRHVDISYP